MSIITNQTPNYSYTNQWNIPRMALWHSTYDSEVNRWISYYPNMLYVRYKPGVVAYEDHVIVMGGGYTIKDNHHSIEIMNCHEMQWRKVTVRLPVPKYVQPNAYNLWEAHYNSRVQQPSAPVWCIPNTIKWYNITKRFASWKRLNAATHYNTTVTVIPYSNPPVSGCHCWWWESFQMHFCHQNIQHICWFVDWCGLPYKSQGHRRNCLHQWIHYYGLGGTSGGSANAENWLNTVEIGHIIPY